MSQDENPPMQQLGNNELNSFFLIWLVFLPQLYGILLSRVLVLYNATYQAIMPCTVPTAFQKLTRHNILANCSVEKNKIKLNDFLRNLRQWFINVWTNSYVSIVL